MFYLIYKITILTKSHFDFLRKYDMRICWAIFKIDNEK